LSRKAFEARLGITVALLMVIAPCALAQSGSSGGARAAKDGASESGADAWDGNHDGIYTCAEWKSYLDRQFTMADRNHDGHLDRAEFATIRRNAFGDADFGYFDENRDGKISRSEFVDKPSEFILRNDKNGDCRVTPDELKDTGTGQKPPGGGKGRGM
jgi:hypothetical protein